MLHNLSFIEDPTRIFRAIRYENRYGLRMDEHTLDLARACCEMDLVGDLSSARLRDELVALLLDEGEVALRPAARGAGLPTGRSTRTSPRTRRPSASPRGSVELKSELHVDAPDWRLRLAAARPATAARRARTGGSTACKVRRRDAEQIASAVTIAPRLAERLQDAGRNPAEIVSLAEPDAPDAPLLALAPPSASLLGVLRAACATSVSTSPARTWPSSGSASRRAWGEVLGELRRRKLRGDLDGRESELAAARELIGG